MSGRVQVRELGESDADAFLALTRRCDVGTGRFVVDRSPDPFALGRHFGPTLTLGAFVDDALVGSAALSTQRRYVAGELRALDYLHDLRVDPGARRRGVARALGEEARRRPRRGAWCFGTVLDDNPLSMAIAAGTSAFLGKATRLGRTAHVVRATARTAPAVEVLSDDAFTKAHRRLAPPHGYAPEARLEGEGLAFVVRGAIVAVARLVDENQRRRFVVEDEPIALGYLAHLAPASPPREAIDAFVAAAAERFRFVAFGLAPEVASALGLEPTFTSSTWSFGAPLDEILAAHELTLV